MEVNLPSGFSLVQCFFSGAALPFGASITWAADHGGGALDPVSQCNSVIALWGTHIKSTITPDVTLTAVRCKHGPMETGPFAQVSATVAGTDTGTNDAPPVALLVRKNTTQGGKAGAGRIYVPGLGSTRVDVAGNVQASDITTRQTAWTAFLAALDTATQPMHLAHTFGTYVNSKGETVTVAPRPPSRVTSVAVQQRAGTQRRRQRR